MTTNLDAPARADGDWSRPLEGVLVLDFSQYLSGPVAALRLADLGARVIKVERPRSGDAGRTLAFGGMFVDGEALNFHALNRNKESFAANLKDSADLAEVRELVGRADVLVHNFRPGVMERIGLGYEDARDLNPRLVYAAISGYGDHGPWRDKPGQDLLAQCTSGMPWLSGTRDDPPIPIGSSIADLLTSCHLAQGITALLYRRERTGRGGLVETSLLESMIDLQLELFSAHLTDSSVQVQRGPKNSVHPFIAAPYGVYPTSDGYLALAMNPVDRLGPLLDLPELADYSDPDTWWSEQEHITGLLGKHLSTRTTRYWLDRLEAADVWCAQVLTLPELVASEGFAALEMAQDVAIDEPGSAAGTEAAKDRTFRTTRSPLRVDRHLLTSATRAPRLGEHTTDIRNEMLRGRTDA